MCHEALAGLSRTEHEGSDWTGLVLGAAVLPACRSRGGSDSHGRTVLLFRPWNYLDVLWLDETKRILEEAMKRHVPPVSTPVELIVAPAAIERALEVYEQLEPHDPSVILQARKILTQHIFGMVDQGELDEQRLTVGGLARLKAVERDHAIKSAQPGVEEPGKK
jgi:hypothetical protein